MNDFLNDWINLTKKHSKKEFIYKRELLIEKKSRWKFLPNTSRYFTSTISSELIPVQPMEVPNPLGFLSFMYYEDFNYDSNNYNNILLIEKIKKSEQINVRF
jgi:hypothetical protein